MKKNRKVLAQRVALYVGVCVVGLALMLGVYCTISSRPVLEVLANLWIACAFAIATAVVTALRDHSGDKE